jgi:DNA primase
MKDLLIQYLEANDLKYIDKGFKVLHQCLNPSHNDSSPSAFTNLENLFSHCSSCGFHLKESALINFLGGNISSAELKRQEFLRRKKELKNKEEETESEIILPKKFKEFEAPFRGISIETFKKICAYVTRPNTYYQGRIVIPLKDMFGDEVGFEAVAVSKELQPKVLRAKGLETDRLFGFEDLIQKNKPLFICEGVFSSLSLIEFGYSSVYNFGVGNIEDKVNTLKYFNVKEVILVGDKDSAGFEWNQKQKDILWREGIKYRYWRWKPKYEDKTDPNDVLMKYGEQELLECIKYNLK